MTDDFGVVDLSEVSDLQDFSDPVPAGWYQCMIEKWDDDREVNKEGGKIPKGTKGTNFTFKVVEGEHTERRFWANYWHYAKSAAFFKSLYKASGMFTDDELNGPMDILGERDRLVGAELWVRVNKVGPRGDYGAKNDVKMYKHLDEYSPEEEASNEEFDSLRP